jgi:hypothetical protein
MTKYFFMLLILILVGLGAYGYIHNLGLWGVWLVLCIPVAVVIVAIEKFK